MKKNVIKIVLGTSVIVSMFGTNVFGKNDADMVSNKTTIVKENEDFQRLIQEKHDTFDSIFHNNPKANKPGNIEATAQTNVSANEFEVKVGNLVNEERAELGMEPLKLSKDITNTAKMKSEEMLKLNYFNHISPIYGSFFDILKKFSISYISVGENIATGQKTPEEVVNSWMNSDGHRKNILNPKFKGMGIGYAYDGKTTYWTIQFIEI